MAALETPSRVWRRIELNKLYDGEMPSLPSLPEADESRISDSSMLSQQSQQLSLPPPTPMAHSETTVSPPSFDNDRQASNSLIPSTPAAPKGIFANARASPQDSAFEPEIADLATPGPRRTNFLMDIIHSTARPRMKRWNVLANGTPHPSKQAHLDTTSWSVKQSQDEEQPNQTITRTSPSQTISSSTPIIKVLRESSSSPLGGTSFISTASSHDLLQPGEGGHNPHVSFDPSTTQGIHRRAVSRFDAPRLNAYLHDLNTRLARENRDLAWRLHNAKESPSPECAEPKGRRRPVSELCKATVEAEMVAALRAELETANLDFEKALQDQAQEYEQLLQSVVEKTMAEAQNTYTRKLEEVQREHEDEYQALTDAREKDTLHWQERIKEAQTNAEAILLGIEQERDNAVTLAQRTNLLLSEKSESAETRIGALLEDIQNARKELEHSEQKRLATVQELDSLRMRAEKHSNGRSLLEEQRAEMERLTRELEQSNTEREANKSIIARFTQEVQTSKKRETQLQESLDDLKSIEIVNRQTIASLQGDIAVLKAELKAAELDAPKEVNLEGSRLVALDVSRLESENESLWERVKQLESQAASHAERQVQMEELQRAHADLRMQLNLLQSTDGVENTSNLRTPFSHKRSIRLKTPKTPGAPLGDISWLNNTTRGNEDVELIRQIRILEEKLRRANNGIDGKMHELEEQGVGIVTILAQLEESRNKQTLLEEDTAKAKQREATLQENMETLKIQLSKAELRLSQADEKLHQGRIRLKELESKDRQMSQENENLKRQLNDSATEKRSYQTAHEEADALKGAKREVDQHLSALKQELSEQRATLERIRSEKSNRDIECADLQSRLSEANKEEERLQQRLSDYEKRHATASEEAAALRRKLKERTKAHFREGESKGVQTIHLQEALKKIQHDAEGFRLDLARLREEKSALEKKHNQEVAVVEQTVQEVRMQCRTMTDQVDSLQAEAMVHKDECRGLLVQITYLQHKWTREATLRSDLCFAKNYLVTLLTKQSHETGESSLARRRLLPPSSTYSRRVGKLKCVATCVCFITRVRRAAQTWKSQRDCRPVIEAALEDVRQRRLQGRH